MTDDKPYIPVSCELHSEFELLIMHNRALELNWHDKNGKYFNSTVHPKDLQTRKSEEFLVAVDNDNQEIAIRLDRINSYKEI
jgi:Rho-binding antiterminator